MGHTTLEKENRMNVDRKDLEAPTMVEEVLDCWTYTRSVGERLDEPLDSTVWPFRWHFAGGMVESMLERMAKDCE